MAVLAVVVSISINQKDNRFLTAIHPTQIDFANGISQQIISTPTPAIPVDVITGTLLDTELALIFVIPLNSNGSIQPCNHRSKISHPAR